MLMLVLLLLLLLLLLLPLLLLLLLLLLEQLLAQSVTCFAKHFSSKSLLAELAQQSYGLSSPTAPLLSPWRPPTKCRSS